MSASDNLSDQQFSYYRGLHLGALKNARWVPTPGIGHFEHEQTDPSDDAAILANHLRQLPAEQRDNPHKDRWSPYGAHWTADRHLAERFAGDPEHGRHNYAAPVHERSYGVVLEARTSQPAKPSAYSGHENQVDVPRRSVQQVTAHLYRRDPGDHISNYVRSFAVPEDHWKNA